VNLYQNSLELGAKRQEITDLGAFYCPKPCRNGRIRLTFDQLVLPGTLSLSAGTPNRTSFGPSWKTGGGIRIVEKYFDTAVSHQRVKHQTRILRRTPAISEWHWEAKTLS
jgi:hypothetical protein